MAKRNSSGSSSGRRGPSRNSRGEGASSGARRTGGKPPFKKSDSRGTGRPSSGGPRKSSYRKSDSGDSRSSGEDRPRGRSFKSGDKPFGKRDEGSGGERKSFGNRRGDSPSSGGPRKSSYRKSDSGDSRSSGEDRPRGRSSFKSDKPFGKRDGDSGGERKSFGNRRGGSHTSSGPRKTSYGKSDSGDSRSSGEDRPRGRSFKSDKPFGKRDGDSGGERKSFGDRRGGSSFSSGGPRKTSYRKSDSGDSRSSGEDRPRGRSSFKSDKPFGKRDERSGGERKSFGNRRDDSSSVPPKSSYRKSDSGEGRPKGKSFKSDKPFGERDKGFNEGKDDSQSEGSFAPTPRKSALKKSDSGESRAAGDKRPRRTSTKPFGEREEEKPPLKAKKEEGDVREERSPKSRIKKDSFDEPKEFVKKPYAERPSHIPEKLTHAQTGKIRLNRYVANSGICSRREADELIRLGLVSVNGKVITEMGYKVNFGDEVRYENKVLTAEKPVYILMNKPKGYITTTDDPQERNTVMHILAGSVKERVYPVGRLDRNTTGLLLLTNDGDLAEKLMHPSYNVKKIYKVELDRPISKADLQKIADGIVLEEGRAMVDEVAVVSDDFKTVGIEIHIGWNRIIRRIFESLSYEVVRLDRSVYAGLDKKELGRGHWRYLSKEEVVRLKHFQ